MHDDGIENPLLVRKVNKRDGLVFATGFVK
jgi:hypothetical protein